MKIYMEENMCTVYKIVFHKMQNILNGIGYENVPSPEGADVCLVGSCAAFNADESRSIEMIGRVIRSGAPVYVFGCMTSVNPRKISGGHIYASWDAKRMLEDITGRTDIPWNDTALPCDFRSEHDYRIKDFSKKFIGISTGCNFKCSYCPHVMGTGPIESIPVDMILSQVRGLSGGETKTIVLTGTDTACYGVDIGSSFARLLGEVLLSVGTGIDIHIAQFNPEGLFNNDGILRLLSDPRIKDVQLPIQTASPRLLRLMNRKYSTKKLQSFIDELKRNNPSVFLRTDLLVGFPTETISDLIKSIGYVRRNFSEAAVYTFERKAGTPICDAGIKDIGEEEVLIRERYAVESLRKSGMLVHSGGQKIETLIKNDNLKELLRR